MSAKSIERTYEIDTEGAPLAPLSAKEKAGLTRRLRAEAKKEGLGELGDTTIVSRTGEIGGVFSVTVRAYEGKPTTEPDEDEGDPEPDAPEVE